MPLPWTKRLYHFLRGPNPLHPKVWDGRLSPLTFRQFEPADLPACLEIYALNEPGRFPEGAGDGFREYLTKQSSCILVAEQGGRIIATGGVSYFLRRDVAVLCYGLVHPEWQGKGVGASLFLARLALLKPDEPAYRVFIFAVEKSIGYYRRFGFQPFTPWQDKQGQQHPSGHLVLTAGEIRQCRELLAHHGITIPHGEDLVKYEEEPVAATS